MKYVYVYVYMVEGKLFRRVYYRTWNENFFFGSHEWTIEKNYRILCKEVENKLPYDK